MMIEENKNLKNYHTLKIDCIAKYFIKVNSEKELIEAIKFAKLKNLPFLIIGGGSNIAFLTKKIAAVVIKNNYQRLAILNNDEKKIRVAVSSGYPFNKFVNEIIDLGGEGIEYHLGLPGTVGGAIYTNAKWTKPLSYTTDCLKEAILLDQSLKLKKVPYDYFQFRYDWSILKETKEVVVEAIFEFKKNDPRIIYRRAKDAFAYRQKTQPQGVYTAGCFFQNPGNLSAGYLIDQVGLKGRRIGDFMISNLHANFIINCGNGQPEDLKKLITLVKEKVYEKYKLKLEEEVIIYE